MLKFKIEFDSLPDLCCLNLQTPQSATRSFDEKERWCTTKPKDVHKLPPFTVA